MTEIAFKRKFHVPRQVFSDEILRKFKLANEYFDLLVRKGDKYKELLEEFIEKLIEGKDLRDTYGKLGERGKVEARDLMFTLLQLCPQHANKRAISKCIENEEEKGQKAIKNSLEHLEKYRKEKEKNKDNNRMNFNRSQNEYFWIIKAVGRSIVPANPEYIENNYFEVV